ncbi:MAG: hypothetical protein ACI85N_001916 [Gammaproteobacteria bacterium]|jgi:hypothetical protein
MTIATEIVQKAKSECTSFEDGKFNTTEQAITLHDFTGDGRPEEIIDASQFSCSSSASMWGGTGGMFLWVLVEGKAYEFLAHRWRVVDMGPLTSGNFSNALILVSVSVVVGALFGMASGKLSGVLTSGD